MAQDLFVSVKNSQMYFNISQKGVHLIVKWGDDVIQKRDKFVNIIKHCHDFSQAQTGQLCNKLCHTEIPTHIS